MPDDESQTMTITNIDEINNQLSAKLNGKKVRVMKAFFHSYSLSKKMKCDYQLSGNNLQLNMIISYSPECTSEKENMCKIEFLEELKNMFDQKSKTPITIQFDNNRSTSTIIKICTLTETEKEVEEKEQNKVDEQQKVEEGQKFEQEQKVDEEEMATTAVTKKRKGKKTTASILMEEKLSKNNSVDNAVSNVALKQSTCSMTIGKIVLVQMVGEQKTNLWDDTRMDTILTSEQKRKHRTVTVYEDTTYRLRVQLGCGGRSDGTSLVNVCDLSQNVHAWVDLNDNGYELSERQIHHHYWSDNFIPEGMYDLNIHIPPIDGRQTKAGSHRMRVTVLPSEQYQRDCGNTRYNESRFFTVNIIPRANYAVVTAPPAANIVYRHPLCYLNTAKILLVLMAGEVGSQIRDDLPSNALLNDYQDRHHLSVTIYDQTVYLIRIRLDCSWQLDTELFANGCNLAQNVNIYIDLNDDGRYDSTEVATPYVWPVTSYMPEGIYDLQIHIPLIDERYVKTGTHRMRLVVSSSDNYIKLCGRHNHNETRDYTINIIHRSRYHTPISVTTPYMVLSDAVCSLHLGKINLVLMAGEHRTQIRDDASTRAVLSTNNKNQQYLSVALYEDMTYLLRLQLDCGQQWSRDSYLTNCHLIYEVNIWIDFNDDGKFDDTENVTPYAWPIHSYTPEGVYDIQVYTPVLDGYRVKSNPHRMSLVATLSEQYRTKCKNYDYRDTREYTATILPNVRQTDTHSGLSYLTLPDNVCSQTNAHVVLVIMTGEKGTHIRDNILTNTPLSQNQNRHHLAVSLYDDATYRIRIQLDCSPPSSRGPLNSHCNLAQDVNVYIDLNNDGNYDESESRVPHRWPLPSSMPLGIYDLEIYIPTVNERDMRLGTHNMRVVVMPSDEYVRKCGRTDYREVRDYTINVIPKTTTYSVDYRDTYCSTGNVVCLPGSSALSSVQLDGEQRTQLRDDMRRCSATNNYNDQTDLIVTLYDQSVYRLHVQLYCVSQWGYENSNNRDPYTIESSCTHARYIDVWMDLNNDGIFDTSTERMVSSDWYVDSQQTNDYNFNVVIPRIDGRNYLSGQHRMRIIVSQDERSRNPCSNTGYGESRDYTVNILPKS